MTLFGNLSVRVDPWEIEYGTELPLDSRFELPQEDIQLEVEHPESDWAAISPAPGTQTPSKLAFVDGVRRAEVRLLVRVDDKLCHGVFGSFAVGSVRSEGQSATFGEPHLGRIVVVGQGLRLPSPVPVMPALTYLPRSIVSEEPDGPLLAIHHEMRAVEERVARELANEEDLLVVMDGPLSFEEDAPGGAVGYVKRLMRQYIPGRLLGVLASLSRGQRTPIFALKSTHRFARYSWFLRLADPAPADSELSGLVRLEVSEAVGLERASQLADATAHALPRFAPTRSRDPRAPQNLLPIGALEADLRRHLGDTKLIRRHLEALVAREARTGIGGVA